VKLLDREGTTEYSSEGFVECDCEEIQVESRVD
jgi:hypothetical protein